MRVHQPALLSSSRNRPLLFICCLALCLAALFPSTSFGQPEGRGHALSDLAIESPENGAPPEPQEVTHHSPIGPVLLWIILILTAAKIGGELAERIGQPAVLGELVVGIVLGNLALLTGGYSLPHVDLLETGQAIDLLAQVGVIILLFEVGLESKIGEMIRVGPSASLVALIGVVSPFFLGFLFSSFFIEGSPHLHIFIGATLTATSVGITARVLRDLQQIQSTESRIILGAAVIDDILGLIILAVVSGIIRSGVVSFASIVRTSLLALGFCAISIILGRLITPRLLHFIAMMRVKGVMIWVSLGFAFLLAYLADRVGLAPIVGAFAAGLILEEAHFTLFGGTIGIQDLIRPLSDFFVPIFFVLMGIWVDLSSLFNPQILLVAFGLTFFAILGKQVCGFGVLERGCNRIAVGLGMIPRGEVGLIFASIGRSTYLHGEPLVSDAVYAAVVIMVVVTTLVTPPALKLTLVRKGDAGSLLPEPGAQESEGSLSS